MSRRFTLAHLALLQTRSQLGDFADAVADLDMDADGATELLEHVHATQNTLARVEALLRGRAAREDQP